MFSSDLAKATLSAALESFRPSKDTCYKFNSLFAAELLKVKLDIPLINVPLPSQTLEFDLPAISPSYPAERMKLFAYSDSNGGLWGCYLLARQRVRIFSLSREQRSKCSSAEAWGRLIDHSPDRSMDFFEEHYRFFINALTYLQSGDPDLRSFQGLPKNASERKHSYLNPRKNLDCTYVGFGFKKPNLRHASESAVSGHFRWQPCGKGRTQVKLIWIDAHTRVYETHLDSSPTGV